MMSKKSGTIKTALGIGGAIAAISAGAIYLGKKIFHRKNEDEKPEETEDVEEVEEDEDNEETDEEE